MRLLIIILSVVSPALFAQSQEAYLRLVNSPYDEQSPVISPDGQTLYFTVGNHPGNISGMKDPGDIWISRKEGSQWSAPVHAGALLNNAAYNAVAGLSPDGSQLFLHGHYTSSGTVAKTQGISVSRRSGAGWSRPENLNIPYYLNKSGILSGALSVDNTVFLFAAESYGTLGVDDLYVSMKQNGKWTAPKNLGAGINTQFQELSPSISDDTRTIYFSTNGRKGYGSFDIYSATRLDDTWTNWSTPQNLGPNVNTEGRELFYRHYPAFGLSIFTTTKSSDGYGDIRTSSPPENVLPFRDTVIYASVTKPQGDDDALTPREERIAADPGSDRTLSPTIAETTQVKVYGRITNAKTGEPIQARISFEGPEGGPVTAVADAKGYSANVPLSRYSVRIEANGYISALEKVDITREDMRDLEMHFKLQPVEVGTTVNLKNVLFAQGKTDILADSYPELDLVVTFLKENPNVKIELMGHTDGRGVHADNVRLSQQRVNKVKEYLVSKGIDSRRISGKGFGGSKPIASNDTEESRMLNRRVEFVIKKF